ncbi:hypothetical protein HY032_03010, partial [Candidatus Gottesmanbacteria bacterium]|nr:hypothetical protein [Candidatus Gottesmanbacteria bacterium]
MRERTLVHVLCVLFLFASLAPTVYELIHQDRLRPERQFELVHNFPTDFNFYLSRIRQGIEGRTTVIEQYTSEPHQGSFIHVLYLALGWLGRWSRVPWERGGDVYHVTRVVFGGLLLVMIAQFCRKAFSGERAEVARPNARVLRFPSFAGAPTAAGSHLSELTARFPFSLFTSHFSLLAFLMAVTASTWPKLLSLVGDQIVGATTSNVSGWRLGGFMPWWSVMDSLQRITFIPHLLLGQTLILFLIMALSDEATMKKPGNWVFLGILAFMEGIFFPPGLLFVIVAIAVLGCFDLLFSKHHVNLLPTGKKLTWFFSEWVLPRSVVVLLSLPSLVYLSLMTSFYPWKCLAEFDIVKPLPFAYGEYLLAVGPILVVGVIGLVVAIWKKEKAMLPSAAWVVAWLGLLGIFQFIPQQSPLRFSEMIPHVPLAVLAAYLFFQLHTLVVSGNALFGDTPRGKRRYEEDTRASL